MASSITRRPRTKLPEERRDELMNAAERLFLEHGFGPTTIEQITVAAQVAKGTFYLYFNSKEDVRSALGERFARDHLGSVKAAVERKAQQDWKGKLSAWAAASVSFLGGRLSRLSKPDCRSFERSGRVVSPRLRIMLNARSDARRSRSTNGRGKRRRVRLTLTRCCASPRKCR